MKTIKLIFALLLYVELVINVESVLENWRVWKKKKKGTPPPPPPNSLPIAPHEEQAGPWSHEDAQHYGGPSSPHSRVEESLHGSVPPSPFIQNPGSFSESPPLSPFSHHSGSIHESASSSPFSHYSESSYRSGPPQKYGQSTSQFSDDGGSTLGRQHQGLQPYVNPPHEYPSQRHPSNGYQQQVHPPQEYKQHGYPPNGYQHHGYPTHSELSPPFISGEEVIRPEDGIFIHDGMSHGHLFPLPAQRDFGQWTFGRYFPNEKPLGMPGKIHKVRPDPNYEHHLQFEGVFSFAYHVTAPRGMEITRVEFVSALGKESLHEKIIQSGKSSKGDSIYFRFWSEKGYDVRFTVQCYTVHSHQQSHVMQHGPVPAMH